MQSNNDAVTRKTKVTIITEDYLLQGFNNMDKVTDKMYENSDVFYNGYHKNKDCNRLQRNVLQDTYVSMEGCICSDRLSNGTYENVDAFCNVCHGYKHNDSKRLYSDLSQDIYVPIEDGYNFMNRLASCTYENGDGSCNTYNHHKDNHSKKLPRNVSVDSYVSMHSFSRYPEESSIESPSQTPAPLAPTDTNKPIEYITGENNIYKKVIVEKIKNFAKKKECQIKTKKSTNKKELRPLSEGFNQILSRETDAEDTKRCYSAIYDVPTPRPILPTKIHHNKESVFRSRSNACVSQNIRTYLKESKSAGI